MQFRINRFFLDEKDLFIFGAWVFVIVLGVLQIPIAPFRFSSLVVVLIFLSITRSLVSSLRFNHYFFIILSGLLAALWLSPYGVAVYLALALFVYSKTHR